MSKYLSTKLSVISFLLMITVVFLHSNNLVVNLGTNMIALEKGYSYFVQIFFADGIGRIAVPLFFFISGYLFFFNTKFTRQSYLQKVIKRRKTLLVPYLLWSLWGLLFYFILQTVPQTKVFFTKDLITNYSIIQFLSTFFLNPLPYQLWFIRDLMVLIAFTPVIHLALKHLHQFTIATTLLLWIFSAKLILFRSESLAFFVLGAYVGIYSHLSLEIRFSKKYLLLLVVWVLIVLLRTTLTYLGIENGWVSSGLSKVSILIGLFAFWTSYDVLIGSVNKDSLLFKFSTYSFFLFASHEPVLTIFKKALFSVLGKSEFTSLFIFLLAPTLTIFLCLAIASLLKTYFPRLYALATGGR